MHFYFSCNNSPKEEVTEPQENQTINNTNTVNKPLSDTIKAKEIKPDSKNLKKDLDDNQEKLNVMIEKLDKKKPTEDGLFYDNIIKKFKFYKTDKEFKAFVDELLGLGYVIKQEEGAYFLYVK